MNASKFKRGLLFAIPFGILLYVGVFIYGSHSESFKVVQKAVADSQDIQSRVGPVTTVSLNPLGGYREKFVNSNKWAYMSVNVTGLRGKVAANVSVERIDGVWKVTEITIRQ